MPVPTPIMRGPAGEVYPLDEVATFRKGRGPSFEIAPDAPDGYNLKFATFFEDAGTQTEFNIDLRGISATSADGLAAAIQALLPAGIGITWSAPGHPGVFAFGTLITPLGIDIILTGDSATAWPLLGFAADEIRYPTVPPPFDIHYGEAPSFALQREARWQVSRTAEFPAVAPNLVFDSLLREPDGHVLGANYVEICIGFQQPRGAKWAPSTVYYRSCQIRLTSGEVSEWATPIAFVTGPAEVSAAKARAAR